MSTRRFRGRRAPERPAWEGKVDAESPQGAAKAMLAQAAEIGQEAIVKFDGVEIARSPGFDASKPHLEYQLTGPA